MLCVIAVISMRYAGFDVGQCCLLRYVFAGGFVVCCYAVSGAGCSVSSYLGWVIVAGLLFVGVLTLRLWFKCVWGAFTWVG